MIDTLFTFFYEFISQFIIYSDIGGTDSILGFVCSFLSYSFCVFLFFLPVIVLYLLIKILTRN